ncbi:HTTM domain-containing protein [soil metagenome]
MLLRQKSSSEAASPPPRAQKSGQGLSRTSGLDLRSLALFRVMLGAVATYDLVHRFQDRKAFYGLDGVLPLDAVISLPALPLRVFFLSEADPLFGTLIGIGVLAALLLTVGYRSRTMALLCWVLVASLNHRNELVLHAADRLQLLFLLWACLLPIGARWSVDAWEIARKRRTPPEESDFHFSVAAVGLHLQVAVVYFTAGMLKARHPAWLDGSHLGTTLNRIEFLNAPGMFFRDLTALHVPMTWSVLGVQLLGACLLLTPWRYTYLRVGTIGVLAALQIGMGAMLNVGLFPWVSIVGLLALIPHGFWSSVLGSNAALQGPALRRGAFSRVRNVVAATLLLIMVVESVNDQLHIRGGGGFVGDFPSGTNFMQRWTMFTAHVETGGWFIVAGITTQGDTINLLRGPNAIDWSPPKDPWNDFPNYRWRILLANALREEWNATHREAFLRHLRSNWNLSASEDRRVQEVTLIEMRFSTESPQSLNAAEPVILARLREWDP